MRFTVTRFSIALTLMLFAAPFAAAAQSGKASRVGLLGLGSAESSPLFEAFRHSLREHGWVEGQSIAIEDRTTVGPYDRLPDVAAELVRLKVDVIVTWGTTAALAARKATETIPIVTTAGADPVETGLAASLARPGGNVTGLMASGLELVGKRLELLKEALPGVSRIALLWNPESRTQALSLRDAKAAARPLSLQVRPAEVRRPEDFAKAFASMARERPQALVLVASNMFRAHRARIVELAAQHRLPATFSDRGYVDAGGLMSYGPDQKAIFRRLANYVDRILKGAKPGDLPIEQPTKFELVINLKTAKALGITIPSSLLLRADQSSSDRHPMAHVFHAARDCPTSRSSGPPARIRSPRPLNAAFGGQRRAQRNGGIRARQNLPVRRTSLTATRRDVLKLSAGALAAGLLPGCRMRAGKPPVPIAVPWTMKSLNSAETKVERLADGCLRFSISHEVLTGVIPAMLVWWFNNMDGTLRIGDVDVPRYRVWHPRDHVALTYLRPGLDGRKFSAGARIRIQEFFGADPRYRVDVVDDVGFLDETGFNHSLSVAGRRVASMDYTFTPVAGGTRYENSLTVGIDRPALLRLLVNQAIRPWLFPEHMGRAWLKHNVEEVGNFQFFLPALFSAETSTRAR